MSERRLAETGQPLEDLTEEQRDEIKTVVREIIQRAHAYSERGRASMPIEVDSALILAGVTAALLYPPGSHHLASGIGYPHLHRTDLTGECGECAASGPIDCGSNAADWCLADNDIECTRHDQNGDRRG